MLEAVRLINCQSFKDSVIVFKPNSLNVIIAENNTGKSVFYKILKLAGKASYYSKADRVDLIKRGESSAQVIFKFTDGTFAMMKILPERAIYAFLEDQNSSPQFQLEPPDEMLERLELLVSNSEDFIANLVDMDQGLLLVDPKLKSNYELVKLIATCEDLDNLREKLEILIKQCHQDSIRVGDSVNFIERQLNSIAYCDVVSMEELRDCAALASETLTMVCDVYEETNKICHTNFNYDVYRLLGISADVADTLTNSREQLNYIRPSTYINCTSELKSLLITDELLATIACIHKSNYIESESELNALEWVESLHSAMSNIELAGEFTDLTKPLTVLDFVEQLKATVEGVRVISAPPNVRSELTAKDFIDDLKTQVDTLTLLVNTRAETATEIKNLEEQFLERGEQVECPIWGTTIFDGKQCHHID